MVLPALLGSRQPLKVIRTYLCSKCRVLNAGCSTNASCFSGVLTTSTPSLARCRNSAHADHNEKSYAACKDFERCQWIQRTHRSYCCDCHPHPSWPATSAAGRRTPKRDSDALEDFTSLFEELHGRVEGLGPRKLTHPNTSRGVVKGGAYASVRATRHAWNNAT